MHVPFLVFDWFAVSVEIRQRLIAPLAEILKLAASFVTVRRATVFLDVLEHLQHRTGNGRPLTCRLSLVGHRPLDELRSLRGCLRTDRGLSNRRQGTIGNLSHSPF